MEITINENAKIERLERHVEAVIEQAKQSAEDGFEYFTYYVTREERRGMKGCLTNAVQEKTDGTVRCCVGGLKDDRIEFYISKHKK